MKRTLGYDEIEDREKELIRIQSYFNKIWNGSKPLAKLLKTDNCVFDAYFP